PNDGLQLNDCRIANAVRCLPPENKPTPVEFAQCRPFLQAELAMMPSVKVILALGKGAHDQILRALTVRPAVAYPFIHGRLHHLPTGLKLADSYHCSRYNTNTGKLTSEMFETVVKRASELAGLDT
ncbi:MAG TPA: uracil-DNA glycosylase family protein, partial [Alphaproteobacteria bacterium]|nr:uracil-DNA glycosylase family protein [Alphaproteobacteria bacterium]